MPAYEANIYNPQYLNFRFFDSAGLVTMPKWGNDLHFDNQEIFDISVSERFSPLVAITAGGKGHATAQAGPEKWTFQVRTDKPETFDKVRWLHRAIEEAYRVEVTMTGFIMYDPGFSELVPVNKGFQNAVIQYSPDDPYMVSARGRGLTRNVTKPFTIIESEPLTVPAVVRGIGGNAAVGLVQLGIPGIS